jgi:hypothetical protein
LGFHFLSLDCGVVGVFFNLLRVGVDILVPLDFVEFMVLVLLLLLLLLLEYTVMA